MIYDVMVPSFFLLFTHGFAIDFSMDVAFPAYMSALFFCFLSLPCPSFPVFPCKMEPAEGKAAEAEEMPPKAGGCQPRHGHERIGRKDYGPAAVVLRSIKRRKVLMNLSLKYRCLGENVLAETLPDPTACASKRKWETAIQKARETLRLMAPDVDPDADVDISLAGTDAVPCISAGCELELAESDGAPDFDGMPDFQWI